MQILLETCRRHSQQLCLARPTAVPQQICSDGAVRGQLQTPALSCREGADDAPAVYDHCGHIVRSGARWLLDGWGGTWARRSATLLSTPPLRRTATLSGAFSGSQLRPHKPRLDLAGDALVHMQQPRCMARLQARPLRLLAAACLTQLGSKAPPAAEADGSVNSWRSPAEKIRVRLPLRRRQAPLPLHFQRIRCCLRGSRLPRRRRLWQVRLSPPDNVAPFATGLRLKRDLS